MTFSPELQQAANKYYHYAYKCSKAKGSSKRFLYDKMNKYRKLTFELYRKEWNIYVEKYEVRR